MNTLQPALDQYYRDGNQAALIEAIEKFRPAPKLVEGYLCYHNDGCVSFSAGLDYRPFKDIHNVRTIPVREVTPPDESKRWVADGLSILNGNGKELPFSCQSTQAARNLVTAHNEAMGFGKEAE